jgi:hypothetical protein
MNERQVTNRIPEDERTERHLPLYFKMLYAVIIVIAASITASSRQSG